MEEVKLGDIIPSEEDPYNGDLLDRKMCGEVLEGLACDAPLAAVPSGIIGSFVPLYIVGYIVSFLWNRPAENITKALVKE